MHKAIEAANSSQIAFIEGLFYMSYAQGVKTNMNTSLLFFINLNKQSS